MTLFPAPLLINGASHPAQSFRMMIRDLARGSEGITQGDDLKVSELDTPGGGVQISDGSGVVRGRYDAFQGSYAVCNAGVDDTITIAANGGGATRYDLVVLRVEDPEYEGTLDPETDPICYFQVIPNVSSTATAPADNRTCIALARIAIPAATATITDAMITDVRQVANPRRERTLQVQSPGTLSTLIGGTSGSYSYFSTAAGWAVAVPDWATTARIKVDVAGLRLATDVVFGNFRATFGASLSMQPTVVDDNDTGTRRIYHMAADTLAIPAGYRGTTQTLRAQFAGLAGNVGTVSVDPSTTLAADVEFFEAPR